MPCNVCKEEKTIDFGYIGPKKILWFKWIGVVQGRKLCLDHLLTEYHRTFKESEARLVVFYPAFEFKDKSSNNYYASTLDSYKEYALKEKKTGDRQADLDVLSASLQKIEGLCNLCEKTARVAFYPQGSFVSKQRPFTMFETTEQVIISSVNSKPEILCMECCFWKLAPSITHTKIDVITFIGGIPADGEYCIENIED